MWLWENKKQEEHMRFSTVRVGRSICLTAQLRALGHTEPGLLCNCALNGSQTVGLLIVPRLIPRLGAWVVRLADCARCACEEMVCMLGSAAASLCRAYRDVCLSYVDLASLPEWSDNPLCQVCSSTRKLAAARYVGQKWASPHLD
jgi:hypothetical protein